MFRLEAINCVKRALHCNKRVPHWLKLVCGRVLWQWTRMGCWWLPGHTGGDPFMSSSSVLQPTLMPQAAGF